MTNLILRCFALLLAAVTLVPPATADTPPRPPYGRAKMMSYRDSREAEHVYLVQEPAERQANPKILIYLHGASGTETQGMDPEWLDHTFARLRQVLHDWKWIYVCPRDYEFPGLLRHLRETYQPAQIFLSGASAGGRAAFYAALHDPAAYAGVILLCPAVRYPTSDGLNIARFTMPMWIVSGEKDSLTPHIRGLVADLKKQEKACHYVEIPNGDHGDPLRLAEWQEALTWLQEHAPPPAP